MVFITQDGGAVEVHAGRRRVSELRNGARRRTAARDAEMWGMRKRGRTLADIAAIFELPLSTVRDGIRRAEALREKLGPDRDPAAMPLFGCRPFASTYLESSHSPTPAPEAECHACHSAIQPGDQQVCMRCHESGHDFALAGQLGTAVVAGLSPKPEPAKAGKPKPPPRLTLAHRIELARTPQGFIWLESIGQLPTEAEMDGRKARRRGGRA